MLIDREYRGMQQTGGKKTAPSPKVGQEQPEEKKDMVEIGLKNPEPEIKQPGIKTEEPEEKTEKASEQDKNVNLTFIHMNDMHGYAVEADQPDDAGIVGGIDRVAGQIKRAREENPAGTVVLDGGDFFDGSFYSKFTEGKIVSEVYKEIGVDAGVIGNHDISWGLDKYSAIAKTTGTEFLGANVEDRSEEKYLDFLKPYTVLERKGVKIGVLGITSSMTSLGTKGKVNIEDPRRTAEAFIEKMKKEENPDMIVMLSHLGQDEDVKIAEKVKGIDLIVGAHSHSEIGEPLDVNGTKIVQAGGEGKFLGELEISFDPQSKKIVSAKENLIPLTKDLEQDPAVQKIMAPYVEKYGKLKNEVLGTTSEAMPSVENKTTRLSNLFINAQKMDSDISITSSFSIRKGFDAGDITFGELFQMYPFDNELLQVKAKGENVLRFIEGGLRFVEGDKDNYIINSDNFSYKWNPELLEGNKVTSLNLNGEEISREDFAKQDINISIDDYTYGKSYFKNCKLQKKYGKVFDLLKDYIKENSLDGIKDGPNYTKVSEVPDPSLLANVHVGKLTKAEPSDPPTEGKFTCASKFYADAIRAETGADISFGFNKSIKARLPEGDITQGMVHKMAPFPNTLMKLQATGGDILYFLEYSREDRFGGQESITSSGINYTYDSSRPERDRITSVTVGGKTYSKADFKKEKFTLAVDDYLKGAKFKKCPVLEEKGVIFQALGSYLKNNSPLHIGGFEAPGKEVSQ